MADHSGGACSAARTTQDLYLPRADGPSLPAAPVPPAPSALPASSAGGGGSQSEIGGGSGFEAADFGSRITGATSIQEGGSGDGGGREGSGAGHTDTQQADPVPADLSLGLAVGWPGASLAEIEGVAAHRGEVGAGVLDLPASQASGAGLGGGQGGNTGETGDTGELIDAALGAVLWQIFGVCVWVLGFAVFAVLLWHMSASCDESAHQPAAARGAVEQPAHRIEEWRSGAQLEHPFTVTPIAVRQHAKSAGTP